MTLTGAMEVAFPSLVQIPAKLRTLFCFSVWQPSHAPMYSVTSWGRAASGVHLQVFWLIVYLCTMTTSPAQLVPASPPESWCRQLGSDGWLPQGIRWIVNGIRDLQRRFSTMHVYAHTVVYSSSHYRNLPLLHHTGPWFRAGMM